jgi:nitric oxide reductase subunit C
MYRFPLVLTLLVIYIGYSLLVYTRGTAGPLNDAPVSLQVSEGKRIWQEKNCTSCHQLYGLGGYLGPELTTVTSDPTRGVDYARAFLINGGPRMPNFRFSGEEIEDILAFLRYVDTTAVTYKKYAHGARLP